MTNEAFSGVKIDALLAPNGPQRLPSCGPVCRRLVSREDVRAHESSSAAFDVVASVCVGWLVPDEAADYTRAGPNAAATQGARIVLVIWSRKASP